MAKIICLGSLNLDHVYQLPHALRDGETMTSLSYRVTCGGKGGNQSIAARRSGAEVLHAGQIGCDGDMLRRNLEDSGVDVRLLECGSVPTGHAVVLVNDQGGNSIVLFPGANRNLSDSYIRRVIDTGTPGDILLMQNETNQLETAMRLGKQAGLKIAFNFAPFNRDCQPPLELVDYLFLNEVEGEGLSGERTPEAMIEALKKRYPDTLTVITYGSQGAYCEDLHVRPPKVDAVDTTAAGDTFIGYFLNEMLKGTAVETALDFACHAAALCVCRSGAAESIPSYREVLSFRN